MAPQPSADYIDPLLAELLESSEEHDEIAAVIAYRSETADATASEAIARSIIDDAGTAVGAKPASVLIMPRTGTFHIRGKSVLVKKLLADDRVCAASLS